MDFIKLSGYKSIKELDFKVKPINILIGANGAGKSNFISYFKFLNAIYLQQMQSYVSNRANKFLYKGLKTTDKISCHLSFANGTNEYKFQLNAVENTFVVQNEQHIYKGDTWVQHGVTNEATIKSSSSYRASFIFRYLKELKLYHFDDVSAASPFFTSCSIHDNLILSSDGHNLSAVLLNLREKNPKSYLRIISTIKQVAPYFADFILEADSTDNIILRWTEIGNEIIYTASDFSDGTMRFIALTVLFLQPKLPQTIIIDEPELGLHPVAIELLSELIKTAAKNNCQIIVATQCADLINYFEPTDIVIVDRSENGSTYSRLSNEEDLHLWIEEYSIGEIWSRNIIGKGQPR